MNILGISAYYHDSAAALLRDGELVAAAQEERFSRKKHDARFPTHATEYCLAEGKVALQEIDYVVFYDKPLLKFDRLLETYLAYAPRGFKSFAMAMPIWLKEKLYLKKLLRDELATIAGCKVKELPRLMFTEHHQAHAASAFFPSPFERAAVLCMDGVGEWATASVWLGEGQSLTPQWEIDFPHSLGMLYSATRATMASHSFSVSEAKFSSLCLSMFDAIGSRKPTMFSSERSSPIASRLVVN